MHRYCALAFSAFVLTGCTSLEAVRSISSDLTSASSSWRAAGDELYESCKRSYAINDSIPNCDASEASSKGLASATEVLRAYFATLASVANESNFSVDSGLEDLSGAVQGIEGVNDDQVKAVTGLAKALIPKGAVDDSRSGIPLLPMI